MKQINTLVRHIVSFCVGATLVAAIVPVTTLLGSSLNPEANSAQEASIVGNSLAASQVFHYQGRLLDPQTGQAKANGTYAMSFAMYNAATGGTALWSENKNVEVENGLFSTLLGDSTALTLNVFDGQELWLGITVGTDAETTPRQRISHVAYAVHAENAAALGGKPSGDFAPVDHAHFALDAADGSPGNALYVSADGNVGIGTTTPAVRLSLGSTLARTKLALYEADATNNYGLGVVAGLFNLHLNSSGARFGFFNSDEADAQEIFTIMGSGNVGVNTRSPREKLEVSGGNIRVSGGSFIDDGTTLNVPDYVFAEDYPLMPLNELRHFVQTEKHLPDIPSEDEIHAHGLNISEFQMKLLAKVEELTLHTLAQQEQIEQLQAQVDELMLTNPGSSQ